MYDLCLINPPHPYLVNPDAQAPLGLLYLAAVVRAAGLEVAIADLACDDEDTPGPVPDARTYGVTGTCFDIRAINILVRRLRAAHPHCRILVGGPVSLSYDYLDPLMIDTVVHGEGENCIVELVTCDTPPATIYPTAAHPEDLPHPARDLWPSALGGDVFMANARYFPGGSTTIMSSRGCPMSCAFCAGPALRPSGVETIRRRRARDVVDEMERTVTGFGVRQFRFSDEAFTANKAHAWELSTAIRQSRILRGRRGCAWRVSVNRVPVDEGMFAEMAASGCREVAIGVETADRDVIELLCQNGKRADAEAAIRACRRAGLGVRALMMVGLPGTTARTVEADVAFIRSTAADAIALTVFTPLPGCAIYQDPERFDIRIRDDMELRSVCLYGPDGRRQIEPTIDINGTSRGELTNWMLEIVEAAEASGKLGKG